MCNSGFSFLCFHFPSRVNVLSMLQTAQEGLLCITLVSVSVLRVNQTEVLLLKISLVG